ncbi:unnamed protein product [Ilex paraguariensis]|uniref:Secreted protein n=1 Tax=Ilex paraguariensis TaxID=185542 RepID=A0ABC8T4K6_9AQUA
MAVFKSCLWVPGLRFCLPKHLWAFIFWDRLESDHVLYTNGQHYLCNYLVVLLRCLQVMTAAKGFYYQPNYLFRCGNFLDLRMEFFPVLLFSVHYTRACLELFS